MPAFRDLAKRDPALRGIVLIGTLFVVLPPIFSYFKDPYGWKPELWQMMVFGFGGPYLVLVFLFVRRWRKLVRLSEGGQPVPAIVEKVWSNREGKSAMVRFSLGGTEHTIRLRVPLEFFDIAEGATATVLVDSRHPENAAFLEVRSSLTALRDELTSRRGEPGP